MGMKLRWVALLGLVVVAVVGCSKKPPVDIVHEGIVVNLTADDGRRPLLRVDVALQYEADVVKKDAKQGNKLAGAEAKAAILHALAELEPAETIAEDKAGAIEEAAEAIKKAIADAQLPAPIDVKLTNFVIQG